jgi:predicted Zn-dependent protease
MDESLRPDYVPLEEERWAKEQADIFHGDFTEQGLLYNEPEIRAYLEQLERRLLAERDDIQDEIVLYALRSPIPNAFAMPNGNIYVHAGLFTTLTTEDQLAAILSHEIAHVTRKHSVQAVIAQKNTLIGAHIGDFATGGLGLVYFGAFANIMHFSRSQEAEADEVGLEMLASAGYQPRALHEAFESLSKDPELKHVKQSIYSSHPSFKSRMEDIEALAARMPTSPAGMETLDETFVELKARMMEDSVNMRLRNRQFNLAKVIVDEAAGYFTDQTAINFYYGEVYRGFAAFVDDAAKEDYWLETGKEKLKKDIQDRYRQAAPANTELAIGYYRKAAEAEPPYPKALRRLGELMEKQGHSEQARDYYTRYLQASPEAVDRRYVERALERIGSIKGDDT